MRNLNTWLFLAPLALLAACSQPSTPATPAAQAALPARSAGPIAYPARYTPQALPPGDFIVTSLGGANTATSLAQSLVGAGVTVSNAAYSGSPLAGGTFSGGTGIIDFDSGVVLSTGKAADIKGPNTVTNRSTDYGGAGDAQLDALSGQTTYDAAVLNFNFTPDADKVYFQYVFSSEEYDEFSNKAYNDVFAFYINGVNCATVGTPAVPVSINTINLTKNTPLYIKNNTPAIVNTQMDGLTVTLTCQADVNKGVVNTMSLRIADATDDVYDSAVMIKAGSFSTTPPINQPPTAPGQPVLKAGSVTPNNTGTHTMTWAPATDPNSNDLIYVLEHKNTTDAGFTAAQADVLTANEKAMSEAEGTWTYRVKANDGTVDGPYSPVSAPVVVDKTAPSAPTATINGAAPTGGWYKDSATVAFGGSTDPVLADTSAGSGVAGYQGGQTVTTSGTFSYSGTATDTASNVSTATTGSFKVDATAPSGSFTTCPTAPVVKNSVQSAAWAASDGQSGLASPASGIVTLDTTTVGTRSVSASATDNVGHVTTFTCTYTVAYNFKGFFSPVDNFGVLNVAKAGSSIPVKFSLGGNQGLNIMAAGYPRAVPIACSTGMPADDIETTVTANASGLQYDASSDTYNYVWKTAKSMVGCYRLEVMLNDGTLHTALFQLR